MVTFGTRGPAVVQKLCVLALMVWEEQMYVLCVSVEALVDVQACGAVHAMPRLPPSCSSNNIHRPDCQTVQAAGLSHRCSTHTSVGQRVIVRCLRTSAHPLFPLFLPHLCGEALPFMSGVTLVVGGP